MCILFSFLRQYLTRSGAELLEEAPRAVTVMSRHELATVASLQLFQQMDVLAGRANGDLRGVAVHAVSGGEGAGAGAGSGGSGVVGVKHPLQALFASNRAAIPRLHLQRLREVCSPTR